MATKSTKKVATKKAAPAPKAPKAPAQMTKAQIVAAVERLQARLEAKHSARLAWLTGVARANLKRGEMGVASTYVRRALAA